MITDNGEYCSVLSGGLYGDGGSIKMQDWFLVYDVGSGRVVFETTNLPPEPDLTQVKNYFTTFLRPRTSSYEIGVFFPEKNTFFYKEIELTIYFMLNSWQEEGMYFKGGSAYLKLFKIKEKC